VLGFFLNRSRQHRAACLVWIPGLAWIIFGMLSAGSWQLDWPSMLAQARIDLFPLKQGECGMTECLGVLLCTFPFMNSLAYSIGAAIALFNGTEKHDSQPNILGLS
jgi:hypothetical protein